MFNHKPYDKILFMLTLLLASVQLQAAELDPTKPFSQLSMKHADIKQHFVLYSIIRNGGNASAIINEQTLGLGDSIGEYQVQDILDNQVILSNSKETLALSLFTNDLVK